MKKTLFVCQGNMVRSQIAEALYKKYKGNNVSSAGIVTELEHHDGKTIKELGLLNHIQAMKDKEDIDISLNICKEITKEMVDQADNIVVMAHKELLPDFLSQRKDLIFWEIDNNSETYQEISEVIDEIKRMVLL